MPSSERITSNSPWRVVKADGSPFVSFGWSPDNEQAARSFAANWSATVEPVVAMPAFAPRMDRWSVPIGPPAMCSLGTPTQYAR